MTPRVVRTVEDRFSDVVNERVDRAQKAIVAKFESEGSAWMSDNSGDRLAWVAAEAIRGMLVRPATILAPLSVTSEQVEAGIAEFVEVWNEGMQADYPEGVYPSERECMAAGFAAALAAMGILVVDSE